MMGKLQKAMFLAMTFGAPLAVLPSGAGQTGGAAFAATEQAMPDGTLTVLGGHSSSLGNYATEGHLKFQGGDHKFSVSGMSVQDAVNGAAAEGSVFNLKRLDDFIGHYGIDKMSKMSDGRNVVTLRNEKGVTVEVRGTTPEMRFDLKNYGVTITMEG